MTFPALSNLITAIRIRNGAGAEPPLGPSAIGKTYRDTVLADEPVMAYIFGNGPTTDAQNQAYRTANNPTTTGTVSSDVYGAPTLEGYNANLTSRALYFDCTATTGRPYVSVPWFAGRDNGTAISFECLIKPRTATAESVVYSSHIASSASNGWRVGVNTGVGSGAISFRYISGATTYNCVVFGADIPPEQTHHVVVTVDNSSTTGAVIAYLNGSVYGSTSLLGVAVPANASETGFIGGLKATGGSEGSNAFYFNGIIDCVAQYDVILTPAQVTAHYEAIPKRRQNLTPHAIETYDDYVVNKLSPAMYIRFNGEETGGPSAGTLDFSGNGNNATPSGNFQRSLAPLTGPDKGALFIPKSALDIAYLEIPYSLTTRHNIDSTMMASVAPYGRSSDQIYYNPTCVLSIGDFGVGGRQQLRFGLNPGSNSINLIYVDSAGTAQNVESDNLPETLVTDGTVSYHIAVTISETDNEIIFYFNGQQIGSPVAIVTGAVQNRTLGSSFIGKTGSALAFNEQGFYGIIDEVSFHQLALTPEQIAAAYSLRGALEASNLDDYVARWSMDSTIIGDLANQPTDERSYINCNSTLPTDSLSQLTLATAGNRVNAAVISDGYDGGNALRFSGNNGYVDTTPPAWLQFSNSTVGSISLWIRPNSSSPSTTIMSCGNQGITNDYGWRLRISSSGNQLQYAEAAGSGATLSANVNTPRKILAFGVWQHVCVVREASDIRIYWNGKNVSSNYFNLGTTSHATSIFGLGGDSGDPTNFLTSPLNNTDVDEIHLFDRALTEQEIADLAAGLVENDAVESDYFGKPINSPTRVEGYDGLADGALDFDGVNQYVSLPDVSALKPSGNNISVVAWAKSTQPSGEGTGASTQTLISIWEDVANTVYHGFALTRASFLIASGTGTVKATDWDNADANIQIADDGWHLYAGTYDGSTIKFYIDGVLLDSVSYSGGLVFDAVHDLNAIGTRRFNDSEFSFMDGSIDDVRLYDRVLSAQEIFYLARTTIPPKPQDMIAEWKFENNYTDTIGGVNLSASGTPTFITGWEGNCVSLNGSSHLFHNAATEFYLQEFTVSFFAKRNSASGNFETFVNCVDFAGGGTPYDGWEVKLANNGTLYYQEFTNFVSGVSGQVVYSFPLYVMLVGVWQHIAVTRTATDIKFYVDGELEGIQNSTPLATITYASADFGIGHIVSSNRFVGEIDEVRIYDRELTADEVRSLALRDSFAAIVPPVVIPPAPFFEATVDVPTITENKVNGAFTTDATVNVSVTGGVGPFTYAWTSSGGVISATAPASATTTFTGTQSDATASEALTCTVTDTGNSNATTTIDVSVSITSYAGVSLSLDIPTIDVNVPNGNYQTALVTATVAGGIGDYTFSWAFLSGDAGYTPTNANQAGASLTFASAFTANGTNQDINAVWRCTVTDSLGNSDTADLTLDVLFGTLLDLIATISNPIIDGYTESGEFISAPIIVLATGGVAPYTYSWTRLSGTPMISPVNASARITQFQGTQTPPALAEEVWRCTVTDSAAIPAQVTVDLDVTVEFNTPPADLTVTLDGPSTIYYYGPGGEVITSEVSVSVAGGIGPYTYNWTIEAINRRGGTINVLDFDATDPFDLTTAFIGWLHNADVVYTARCTVTDSTPGTPRTGFVDLLVDVITY